MKKVFPVVILSISAIVFSCKPKPVIVPKDPGPSFASAKDKSGNSYKTLRIGSQTWMLENLKTIRYSDVAYKDKLILTDSIRTLMPLDSSILYRQDIPKDTLAYYWKYQDGPSKNDFGKLYTWYAVANRNICPQGFRVPSESDWDKLIDFLGGQEVAGGKMKSTDSSMWAAPNVGATNSSYFNAIGGGFKTEFASFINQLKYGYYWSATEDAKFPECGIAYVFYAGSSKAFKMSKSKKAAFSVRCISNK
jgi:uncharacterized protein (TIGR02145 family)